VGTVYDITSNYGVTAGANEFFSFQTFSLDSGCTALFTAANNITNVISRVTGGVPSSIEGTIRLSSGTGTPGFFFINPSGVTFSGHSQIDVPASFYVATANFLQFPDGKFYSSPTQQSRLSTELPTAFGFNDQGAATVEIAGSQLSAGATGNQTFSIIAGNVTIDGDGTSAGIQNETGSVRVIAVGDSLTAVPIAGRYNSSAGSLTIENGGGVQTTGGLGTAAGAIFLSAGSLTIDGMNSISRTGVFSTAGSLGAGAITVSSSGNMALKNGGGIYSSTSGAGAGADVVVNTGSLNIEAPSANVPTGILSTNDAPGGGGSISITAGTLTMDGAGAIAGGPFIGIGSFATTTATGNSGNISLDVAGSVSVNNGSAVHADTAGDGNAGNVTVHAASISLDYRTSTSTSIPLTEIASSTEGIAGGATVDSRGNSGTVSVTSSGPISILNGADISANSDGLGNAGTVRVSAASIDIDGGVTLGNKTLISADAVGLQGSGGSVNVTTTGALTLANGGAINASTYGAGSARGVTVTAGSIAMNGGTSAHFTGIASESVGTVGPSGTVSGTTGNAGTVSLTVTGELMISNSAYIGTDTYGSGNGGDVYVHAGSITVNGDAAVYFTGISSSTEGGAGYNSANSLGNAGKVVVTASGPITLLNGGEITSDSDGLGNAGDVSVSATSLTLSGYYALISSNANGPKGDGGDVTVNVSGPVTISNFGEIASETYLGTSGAAGKVTVSASGPIALLDGGVITSASDGNGNAGTVTVSAGSIKMDGGSQDIPTSINSDALNAAGAGGDVTVKVGGALSIANNAEISARGSALGNAGAVTVSAGSLNMDGGSQGASIESEGLTGAGGDVTVKVAGALSIANNARISAFSEEGNSGVVSVTAGTISISHGEGIFTGITSETGTGSTGAAGSVTVTASGALDITSEGVISTATFGSGRGGNIDVSAGSISIVGDSGPYLTGIGSTASSGSTGAAGKVTVHASGPIALLYGGAITSSSSGLGNAGAVTVSAGSINMDGGGQGLATFISSDALGAKGAGGDVTVNVAGALSIANNATISADTSGSGNAGVVSVTAATISISNSVDRYLTGILSQSNRGSSGSAGSVIVDASGALDMSAEGAISTSTSGSGRGGDIDVSAGSISIVGDSGPYTTRISSNADSGSTGAAGKVTVTTSGELSLTNGGELNSTTYGPGDAGQIDVTAGSVSIGAGNDINSSGIFTSAFRGSSGAAGSIDVNVAGDMAISGLAASISSSTSDGNGGTVLITSAGLSLFDGGSIATTATGRGNSGDIVINIRPPASMDAQTPLVLSGDSAITTNSAVSAGGNIIINAKGNPILMNDSLIEATAGANGAGGDVSIYTAGNTIVQESGILARADHGNGGVINLFFVPGAIYIQDSESEVSASSNTGNNGKVVINSPQTDLNPALSVPEVAISKTVQLDSNICRHDRENSTFSREGRGGVAAEPDGYLKANTAGASTTRVGEARQPAATGSVDPPRRLAVSVDGCR
jgi:filamentous hemagglutinin family protein